MVREMENVKSYQLGLVSWGLITHYNNKGDCNWMFIDHNPEFGPAGTPTFESMFPNEVKDICEAWVTYCEHIQGAQPTFPQGISYLIECLVLKTGVCGDTNKYTTRKKKKMKFQMDGQFPLLPCALAAGHEKTDTLQLMIREFMALHYQLACGKELTTTPWRAITNHQSRLWDSNMWPSGVVVQDPSKIVLGDCWKIVTLWRHQQAQGGASHTFRSNFYIQSEGLQASVYPTFTPVVITPPVAIPPTPTQTQEHQWQTSRGMPPGCSDLTPMTTPLPQLQIPADEGMHSMGETLPARLPGSCENLPLTDRPPGGSEVNLLRPGTVAEGHLPSLDEPESDPPLEKGKQRKKKTTPSTGEDCSSDVSTDDGRKGRGTKSLRLQRSLVNMSPEPAYENYESLPPRLGKKKGRKKARRAPAVVRDTDDEAGSNESLPPKGRKKAKRAPAVVRSSDDKAGSNQAMPLASRPKPKPKPLKRNTQTAKTQGGQWNRDDLDLEDSDQPDTGGGHTALVMGSTNGTGGGNTAPEGSRARPKPKPVKKKVQFANPADNETQAEQRDREDSLFIVRKSGHMLKPKFNFALLAQLRLEKEREARK